MENLGYLILGLVVAFNFLVILRKLRLRRFADSAVDLGLLTVLSILFSGSYGALIVGNMSSMIISLYLFKNPVTIKGFFVQQEVEHKGEDKVVEEIRYRSSSRYGRY